MNVKQQLKKIQGITNVVCRDDGTLEVYSLGDVKPQVFQFLNMRGLINCFIKVDFYDMEEQSK